MKITKTNLRKLVREASDPFGLGGAGAFRKYGDDVRWSPEAAAPKRARKPRGVSPEQGFRRLMKLASTFGADWLSDNPTDGSDESYSLADVAYDLGDAALHSADPRDVEAAKKYIAGNTGSRNETSIKYMLRDALGDAVADARPSKRR